MSGRQRGRFSGMPPPPPPVNSKKGRDEDLVLFRELFKREQDRTVSFLDPVSDEFEPTGGNGPQGNNHLHKVPSWKKGSSGYDFLATDEKKNDYDWLKTPPATPLFPSLELEAGDLAHMVVHRELPILNPIKPASRLGATEKQKLVQRPKSPSCSSASSSRSGTPRALPMLESMKLAAKPAIVRSSLPSDDEKKLNAPSTKPVSRKDNQADREVLRKPASVGGATTKARSRGTSPAPKPSFPAGLPGFTDETPPNLITSAPPSRPSSRGRTGTEESRPESRSRRLSCSPNTTRGRKSREGEHNMDGRGGLQSTGNCGSVVHGSMMVEKMMNARKVLDKGADKRPTVAATTTATGGTGFGRLMSKSSLDMALKNLELKKEPSPRQQPKVMNRNAKTPTPAAMRGDGTIGTMANRNAKTPTPAAARGDGTSDAESPRIPPPAAEARSHRGRFVGGGDNNGRNGVANKGESRNYKYGL